MAGRRVRIVRVRVAAWATVAAAFLALPLGFSLVEEYERERPGPLVVRQRVDGVVPPLPAAAARLDLEPPSSDGPASIEQLRVAGDVEGLLALAERNRHEPGAGARRRAALAVASLGFVPTPEAEDALRRLVQDASQPSLERTTALAALWERGAVEFVHEQGRDSDDPAIRCKARILQERGTK